MLNYNFFHPLQKLDNIVSIFNIKVRFIFDNFIFKLSKILTIYAVTHHPFVNLRLNYFIIYILYDIKNDFFFHFQFIIIYCLVFKI